MPRVFVYDGREFPDPDSSLSVEDVRKQLSDFFPELTNADTREERRGDDEVRYTFATAHRHQGRRPSRHRGDPPPGAREAVWRSSISPPN